MRKSKVIIIALIVAVIASIVVWCVVSSNAKDEKVQQEIDAVVKVFDEASGDSANPAEVGGSETSRELASESGASPIESGDSIGFVTGCNQDAHLRQRFRIGIAFAYSSEGTVKTDF